MPLALAFTADQEVVTDPDSFSTFDALHASGEMPSVDGCLLMDLLGGLLAPLQVGQTNGLPYLSALLTSHQLPAHTVSHTF